MKRFTEVQLFTFSRFATTGIPAIPLHPATTSLQELLPHKRWPCRAQYVVKLLKNVRLRNLASVEYCCLVVIKKKAHTSVTQVLLMAFQMFLLPVRFWICNITDRSTRSKIKQELCFFYFIFLNSVFKWPHLREL